MKLRDQPCAQCGWKFPGFHVCVDLSKPCAEEGQIKVKKVAKTKPAASNWRERRASHAERDKEMIEKYGLGSSYRDLAEEYGISKRTVMRVMHKADERGEVTIRPSHYPVHISMGV